MLPFRYTVNGYAAVRTPADDEVGLPCWKTIASPWPSSTYAIRLPLISFYCSCPYGSAPAMVVRSIPLTVSAFRGRALGAHVMSIVLVTW